MMNGTNVKFSNNGFSPVTKMAKKIVVDEWQSINKKRAPYNTDSADTISARIQLRSLSNRELSSSLAIGIGSVLCEMLGWKKSDTIQILVHRIDKHIIKLIKTDSHTDGYKLSHTSAAKSKHYLKFRIDYSDKNIADKTIDAVFDVQGDHIICDLSEIIK